MVAKAAAQQPSSGGIEMSSPTMIRPLCGDEKIHEARGKGGKGLAGTKMAKIVDQHC